MSALTDVTEQALALSSEERTVLAQRMWDSLEHFRSSEIEKAWMDEALWRWQEIEDILKTSLLVDQVYFVLYDDSLGEYAILKSDDQETAKKTITLRGKLTPQKERFVFIPDKNNKTEDEGE